jgi:uncharacterized protein (DUF1697 family)
MPHLALLRGVNVGGSNRLPMRELESAFTSAGASAVKTYVQSGNVIFESNRPVTHASILRRRSKPGSGSGRRSSGAPLTRGGRWSRRTRSSRRAQRSNPFMSHASRARRPPRLQNPRAYLPDELIVADAHVYLTLPNGVARSALTNAQLDKALGTVSTIRNWRTAIRLLELLAA